MLAFLSLYFSLAISFANPIQIELNNYPFRGTFQSTLSAQAFFYDVEKFDGLGNDSEIVIKASSTPLPYKTWLQEHPAPLVIVLPGVGSHFRSTVNLRLAKMLFESGYSVLSTSNVFNFEFIESALTSNLPGYTPQDTLDLHNVLAKILKKEKEDRGDVYTKLYVTGYSHGALHTLFLAALEQKLDATKRIGIQKFVALNPPIDPNYSLEYLDDCYNIYKTWNVEERKSYYLDFAIKLNDAGASRDPMAQTKILKSIPDAQAQVALGTLFRTTLRETLWMGLSLGRLSDLLSKGPLSDLNIPASQFSRREFYAAIEKNFSFRRYVNDVVIPEQIRKNPSTTPNALKFESSLFSIEATLRNSPNVKVFHNTDDQLMHTPETLKWLTQVLGERIIIFDRGGHMGNLYMPQFKRAYLEAFNQ